MKTAPMKINSAKPSTPMDRMSPMDKLSTTKVPSGMTPSTPPVKCNEQSCKFMCEAVVNMELLYLKAKMFHWNVRGCDFKMMHETFDEIEEVALEAADKLAERHRFLGDFVDNSVAALEACRWFPDGFPQMDLETMKTDMIYTLDCINSNFMVGIKVCDDVTSNICQDICASIDKMNYFLRSSLPNA